jgi:hypothetical protein
MLYIVYISAQLKFSASRSIFDAESWDWIGNRNRYFGYFRIIFPTAICIYSHRKHFGAYGVAIGMTKDKQFQEIEVTREPAGTHSLCFIMVRVRDVSESEIGKA